MSSDEPVPAIPLQYADPELHPHPRRRAAARVCTLIGWLCCLVALCLILYEVESVIFTGPVIVLSGVLMTVSGSLTRDLRVALLGAAHCAVCVLFVALVNWRNWDPGDARLPFLGMGTVYTGATALPTWIAVVRGGRAEAQNDRA